MEDPICVHGRTRRDRTLGDLFAYWICLRCRVISWSKVTITTGILTPAHLEYRVLYQGLHRPFGYHPIIFIVAIEFNNIVLLDRRYEVYMFQQCRDWFFRRNIYAACAQAS